MIYDDFADDPARGCAPGKANPDDFFRKTEGAIARAKRACRSCPFTSECLQRALNRREEHGVWAGVNMASARERREARDHGLDDQVTDLYRQGLSDGDIGLRIGRSPGDVCKIRTRLRLPALYGPGGRPRTAVAA